MLIALEKFSLVLLLWLASSICSSENFDLIISKKVDISTQVFLFFSIGEVFIRDSSRTFQFSQNQSYCVLEEYDCFNFLAFTGKSLLIWGTDRFFRIKNKCLSCYVLFSMIFNYIIDGIGKIIDISCRHSSQSRVQHQIVNTPIIQLTLC